VGDASRIIRRRSPAPRIGAATYVTFVTLGEAARMAQPHGTRFGLRDLMIGDASALKPDP